MPASLPASLSPLTDFSSSNTSLLSSSCSSEPFSDLIWESISNFDEVHDSDFDDIANFLSLSDLFDF